MYFRKNNAQVSRKRALGLLFTVFAGLLIAGCSADGASERTNGAAEETADKSEQAIRAVIEEEFNGPDEEYKEVRDTAMEAQVSDKYADDYEAYLESPEYQALMSYTEETYAAYFTANGYENFINTAAFMYSFFDGDYTLNTSAIEIAQSENGPTLYNFTFQVVYTDENGESDQFDFEGKAIVLKEGKIGKIEYLDGYEDGLLAKLQNNESN